MSNQPPESCIRADFRNAANGKPVIALYRLILMIGLLVCGGLCPATALGDAGSRETASPPPRLIKSRQADTPATIAARYLNDASKGWMIQEYNALDRVAAEQAVVVPLQALVVRDIPRDLTVFKSPCGFIKLIV